MAFDHALVSSFLFLILITTIIISTLQSEAKITEFIFNGFNNSETNLTLVGATVIKESGALRLTNTSKNVIGHAFYDHPIQMFEKSDSSNVSSFSSHFVFAIVPESRTKSGGGHGLAFTISPFKEFRNAEAGQFMGIFNSLNNNLDSNRIFAVEFDTVNGFNERADHEAKGNHVGININSMYSLETEIASYHPISRSVRGIALESGDSIQAWVDYDGVSKVVNVTIAPLLESKPMKSLLAIKTDLSSVFERNMFVGFSASTGEKASAHYILGWSFVINGHAPPPLNQSQLPKPSKNDDVPSLSRRIKIFIGMLACMIFLLGMWGFTGFYRKKKHIEVLEEWELDCPHRFKYDDLYEATKGFKDSELIGAGGFGAVYKGVLPCNGSEIAVKKIARHSIQGESEFAAEVKSLGKLRHKNLVNLQGWCKKKEDLLLIYDYIPYGSLDSLLYNTEKNNFVLSWDQRRNILKGIASALLYLHEDWDQVVIHRDVKSSNVLIDHEMNGRLGDFGLARLYNHSQDSHTTNVVGTPGYIAPELARTGKSSTSSDVFAYGILVLEVACGQRPIYKDPSQNDGYMILVDWVMQCEQIGRILDAVDPKLNENYVAEDVEMVLRLGLLCSHPREQARPTMSRVIRYLNRDEAIPDIDDLRSSFDSFDKLTARFNELALSDSWITKSNPVHLLRVCHPLHP